MRNFAVFFIIFFSLCSNGFAEITLHRDPSSISIPIPVKIKRQFGLCNESLGLLCHKHNIVLDLAAEEEDTGHSESALAIFRGVGRKNDKRGCKEYGRLKALRKQRFPCSLSLSNLDPGKF